jgi:hypothetical protein
MDEDASENSVVLALRQHGVDVLTVVEARQDQHSGIILIPRHRYGVGEKIRKLLELLENTNAQSLRNALRFL